MRPVFIILLAYIIVSCQEKKSNAVFEKSMSPDVHSFARPNEARVRHLDLNLRVDFENRKLEGVAIYDIEMKEGAGEIVFDSDHLQIKKVETDNAGETSYRLDEPDEILGSALHIELPANTRQVRIFYETSPGARALQWLNPAQTAGKERPFLFTQSQAILARSWIPCQDSPGIRFTYSAEISVPKGFLALMSAENPQKADRSGRYHFTMPQPIPSYLMALTVGQIEFKEIGPRTGVYAEPVMLEKCHNELADMEQMLISAEELYGSYAWGRYDVIVLPPSFPFGGMENPRLTFATPTIIAGDRSLTSLVAHEMAHSWSGNLVTNATWNDFWLNEGFTVYFEQRIMEAVYGRDYSEMLAFLSYTGLVEELGDIEKKNPEDSKLKLNLKGRDPDDGMSAIAYDKGYLFLRKIEETIGREAFDRFLKSYFSEHAFEVMDTETFLGLLKDALPEGAGEEIGIDQWVYGTGLPDNHPVIKSDRFKAVENSLRLWLEGKGDAEIQSNQWSTHEWLHFINSLPRDLNEERIRELDQKFHFTDSGNCEILAAWFRVAIRANYHESDEAIKNFLIHVGRRKFLTPIYKALIEQDSTRGLARSIYEKARPNYHSVSTETIDELLDWKS